MTSTLQSIQDILLANFPLKPDDVAPEARLEDLDIDSLSIVEVLFEVEEKFGIAVPSDSGTTRNTLKTVGDLATYVDGLIAGQKAGTNADDAGTTVSPAKAAPAKATPV